MLCFPFFIGVGVIPALVGWEGSWARRGSQSFKDNEGNYRAASCSGKQGWLSDNKG